MTSFNEFCKKKKSLLNESFLNNRYPDAMKRIFVVKKIDNCIKAFYNTGDDAVFDVDIGDEVTFNCFSLENSSFLKEILEKINEMKSQLGKMIVTPTHEKNKNEIDKIIDTIKNIAFHYLMTIDHMEKIYFSQDTINHSRATYQEIVDRIEEIENYDDVDLATMFNSNSKFINNINKIRQQINILYNYIRTNSEFQYQVSASGTITLFCKITKEGYELSGILACPENIKIWNWEKDQYHDRHATDEELCCLLISELQDKTSLIHYYDEVENFNYKQGIDSVRDDIDYD